MATPIPPPPDEPAPARRPATLREVAGAVFWSVFGVRKGRAMRQDAVSIRPHQVVIVGVVLAALLVFALLGLVRLVMRVAGT